MKYKESMKIREANIDDYNKVYKITEQVHKIHIDARSDVFKDIDPLSLNEFKNRLINKNTVNIIAEVENEILGVCFAEIKEIVNNNKLKDRKYINISNICVQETAQRNNIGRKLYDNVKMRAKQENIDNIELTVWGFNCNAIKFYEKIGMKIRNIKFEQSI